MKKMVVNSRTREAAIIRQANRASAAGRLLLGEFDDWAAFLKADTDDLVSLPRKMLKAGKADVQQRLSKEIDAFCISNFIGMDQQKLSALFEEIKARRGFELPLHEFEKKFAKVRSEVLGGSPKHCTVAISLWGFRLKYPEFMLADDVIESLAQIRDAEELLSAYRGKSHEAVKREQKRIASAIRRSGFGSRTCVLACFNLVEAFLNGLAWDFSRDEKNVEGLPEKRRKLLEDGKFYEKIIEYPEIIAGKPLWTLNDEPVKSFMEQVKPFRDSLVHPSPFSKPMRYGGIDKLEHLYRVDGEKARQAANITVSVLQRLFDHVNVRGSVEPQWMCELSQSVGLEVDRSS